MRIKKKTTKRRRKPKLKRNKKLKRGRGFWDNLGKGVANAYGFSDYYYIYEKKKKKPFFELCCKFYI